MSQVTSEAIKKTQMEVAAEILCAIPIGEDKWHNISDIIEAMGVEKTPSITAAINKLMHIGAEFEYFVIERGKGKTNRPMLWCKRIASIDAHVLCKHLKERRNSNVRPQLVIEEELPSAEERAMAPKRKPKAHEVVKGAVTSRNLQQVYADFGVVKTMMDELEKDFKRILGG